MTSLPFKT